MWNYNREIRIRQVFINNFFCTATYEKTAVSDCGFFLIFLLAYFNLANAVFILSIASTSFSSLAAVLKRIQLGAPNALPVTMAT